MSWVALRLHQDIDWAEKNKSKHICLQYPVPNWLLIVVGSIMVLTGDQHNNLQEKV